MKTIALAFGVALLLVGAIVVVLRPAPDLAIHPQSAAGTARFETKSSRGHSPPQSREEVFHHLLALRDGRAGSEADFAEIESFTRGLTIEQLLELAEPEASSFGYGMERWVRCAAFAELGRRDGEGMVARMMEDFPMEPNDERLWVLEPALFSIFRGWAEVDARAAAARLLATRGTYRDSDGSQYYRVEKWRAETFVEVFKEWARLDPNEARLAVPPPGAWPHYFPKAWQGIFLGMQDPAQIRSTLADWRSESAGRNRTYDHEYREQEDAGRFLREEWAETEAIALGHLADFGLPEMVAWLHRENQDPFSGRMQLLERLDQVLELYACHHPDEALTLIRAGESDGELDPVMLGGGVSWAHPERTAEVLASLTDRFQIIDVLEMAIEQDREGSIRPLGLGRVGNDGRAYPAPGRLNLRSDLQYRYETLLTAIESSPLEQRDRSNLLLRLHAEFEMSLPAARAALGLPVRGRID